MIKIRVFRAIDNLQLCQKYVEGHMHVLKIFGITMITSAKIEWFLDPNTYVIIAESEDGQKIYGGARIQVANGTMPLPIETAVGELDPSIFPYVNSLAPKGTGELCGLWNSREVAGFGLGSIYLGRIGVAISSLLELDTLFALCAPSTLANCLRVGFRIEQQLGKNGTFYYPKEDLLATALLIHDTKTLNEAEEYERSCILELRNNPINTVEEKGIKKPFTLNYDLTISRNGTFI